MHDFLIRSGLFVGVLTFTLITVAFGFFIYYLTHILIRKWIQICLYSTMTVPNNLIYTTVFGILAFMMLLAVYRPDQLTLLLVGWYLAFLGVVLYFVLLMTNPLEGPLKVKAKPFQLLNDIIEQRYD